MGTPAGFIPRADGAGDSKKEHVFARHVLQDVTHRFPSEPLRPSKNGPATAEQSASKAVAAAGRLRRMR